MDTHLLSYFAGFIDADGYITVARSRGPERRDGRRPLYYIAKIVITQADDAICQLAVETFGGKVYQAKVEDRVNQWFQWHCLGAPAVELARLLLPYLRLKREQAEILIRFSELIASQADRPSRALISPEMEQARDKLYLHLRSLNSPRDRRRRELIPGAAIKESAA